MKPQLERIRLKVSLGIGSIVMWWCDNEGCDNDEEEEEKKSPIRFLLMCCKLSVIEAAAVVALFRLLLLLFTIYTRSSLVRSLSLSLCTPPLVSSKCLYFRTPLQSRPVPELSLDRFKG